MLSPAEALVHFDFVVIELVEMLSASHFDFVVIELVEMLSELTSGLSGVSEYIKSFSLLRGFFYLYHFRVSEFMLSTPT
jgi:hypothetical protein